MSLATIMGTAFNRSLLHRPWLKTTVSTCVAAALALGFGFAGTAHAMTYYFVTMDDPDDLTFNQLLSITNEQTIVGYHSFNPNKGYILVPYRHYSDQNFPDSVQTQVTGINRLTPTSYPFTYPTIVGFYIDKKGNNLGFHNTNGTFHAVAYPDTPLFKGTRTNQLLGVNNSGLAVGFYLGSAGNSRGYMYDIATNGYKALPLPFSKVMSFQATSINDSGVICGFYTDTGGNTHGFYGLPGHFISVDAPSSLGTATTFFGINNEGMLVGILTLASGESRGLIYDSNTRQFTLLRDPKDSPKAAFGFTGTTINGVNDLGQIVGFYSDGTKVHGFFASP